MAARIAIMAITTNNSIKVKPFFMFSPKNDTLCSQHYGSIISILIITYL